MLKREYNQNVFSLCYSLALTAGTTYTATFNSGTTYSGTLSTVGAVGTFSSTSSDLVYVTASSAVLIAQFSRVCDSIMIVLNKCA